MPTLLCAKKNVFQLLYEILSELSSKPEFRLNAIINYIKALNIIRSFYLNHYKFINEVVRNHVKVRRKM